MGVNVARADDAADRALDERFVAYRRTGDRRLRDDLVEAHVPLAQYLARRFAHRGEPHDDLLQVALLGLLKAVERFEPDRGLQFSTFATPTIVGELKRHFRDRGWAMRVPRRVQELHLQLSRAVSAMSQSQGRSPTPKEVAESLGVSEEEVLEAMEAGQAHHAMSLDAQSQTEEGEGVPLTERLGGGDPGFDTVEYGAAIEGAMESLSERDRTVLHLRFVEDMTQTEIAERVGVSQMHVSRILRSAVERLRGEVEPESDGADS